MKILLAVLLVPLYCFGQATVDRIKYPFNFQVLEELSYNISINDTIIPIYADGKFHYVNSYTKQPLLDQSFDEAYPFHKGYGLVKKDNKYGIIDKKGNYVLKPAYKSIFLPDYPDVVKFNTGEYFEFNDGKLGTGYYGEQDPVVPYIYRFKKGAKYGLVLKEGKKSDPIYDSILFINIYSIVVKKHGKIGIIDNNQKTILPFIYDEYAGNNKYWIPSMFALKKGTSWLYFSNYAKLFESPFKPALLNNNLFIFENNGLYNYFDDKGDVMLPKYYKWISASLRVAIGQSDEVVILNNKNEEFIYYNR
ncbi:MAG: WG repeat-containing protein [Mucilaginibacter sp.]